MNKLFFLFFILSIPLITTADHLKFSLITHLYNEPDSERMLEYITCLEKNIAHDLIDDIHVIYDFSRDDTENKLLAYLQQRPVTIHYHKGRSPFAFCFSIARSLAKNQKIIIANGDIYFNETLKLLDTYDLHQKFLGLTRWDVQRDGSLKIFKQYRSDGSFWDYSSASSQDAWIFQLPLNRFYNDTIQLGTMSCDCHIAFQAKIAGLTLVNPCLSVQCCHLHLSSIRNYDAKLEKEPVDAEVIYWSELPADSTRSLPKKNRPQPFWDHLMPTIGQGKGIPFMCAKDKSKYSLDTPFIMVMAKVFKAPCFIETGTYLGDTLGRAAPHFAKLHSIELSPTLAQSAKDLFKKKPHVTIHQGDSPAVLAQLLPDIKDKMIIYLDANYNEGSTAKGTVNDPICDELDTLKKSGITTATLIIDDTRLFYDHQCDMRGSVLEGYPTLNQLVEKILSINPRYRVACISDTLIAYTDSIGVTPLVYACTVSRLYDGTNFTISTVITAENIIANAIAIEKDALKNLAENFTEPWGQRPGLSRHYPLWYGLILLNQKDYEGAYNQFKIAYDRGLTHWRVGWYMAQAQNHMGRK